MKYLKLFIKYDKILASDESSPSALELIKELQDNNFFNEKGLIQYEDEQEDVIKNIFNKYCPIIKANNNDEQK